jgi:glycosyltransferase involved in cell wall biosynthesis
MNRSNPMARSSRPSEPRVLHLSTARGWRGGEQQLSYLLTALHTQGIRMALCCPENAPLHRRLYPSGIPIYTYSSRGMMHLKLAAFIRRLGTSGAFDLVHTHDSHAHSAAFLASLAGCRLPIIVSRRVDFPVGRHFLSGLKYNHHRIARILCVSDAIRRVMMPAIRREGILMTIHSGIDPARFPSPSKTGKLHALLGLSQDTKLVGNTAALADHKDYPTFLRAAAHVLALRRDVHFVIIGEGPERSHLEALIGASGIGDRVHLTGFREDVPDLLPDVDVLLMTSKTEGLGTSVLDAFACGVPVVATRAGGIPEMIEHEVTGLLAEVGDDVALAKAVLRLLDDALLHQALCKAAGARLGSFTIQATADRTLAVYRSVHTHAVRIHD